jgi:hypothetical protein
MNAMQPSSATALHVAREARRQQQLANKKPVGLGNSSFES